MNQPPDAIVIGAGPNGLVAANHLLDAGWSVLVLEAQPDIGGAVRSANDVHPDFIHDTFSAFYPLSAASPTIQSFGLDEHGLTWKHAPAVLGHQLADGQWALLHRDRHITAQLMDELQHGDGEAWLELCATWDRIGDHVIRALLSPFPPLKDGSRALASMRRAGGMDTLRTLLTPAIEVGRQNFRGMAPRILIAGNAAHADLPLDAAGSGLMGILLAMLGQTVGFPVPEGGAGALARALARRCESLGGTIQSSAEVVHIDIDHGRATGVTLADGERMAAGRAVLADVVAPNLYGGLVAWEDLPARTAKAMKSFELDPGTVKVDWALDGAVPWASAPAHAPGTVHVADSIEEMSESLAEVARGTIPANPFMLVGQMSTADATRSAPGTEALWAYTHIPQRTVRDAGGSIRGAWDDDDCQRFADRMQSRLEKLAPGFGSRIVGRRVLGPREIEARDANLLGGAINGGTAQLHQQLIFRPVPGLGRAETPIKDLYMASASAHPGGGVHGAPGMNAARAAVAHHRMEMLLRWRR